MLITWVILFSGIYVFLSSFNNFLPGCYSLSFSTKVSPLYPFWISSYYLGILTRSVVANYYAGTRDLLPCCFKIEVAITSLPYIRSVLRLSTSALPLSFPRVYSILNLYYPKSSNYRTYLRFSCFVVIKLSRFLWSIYIVSSEQLSV